VCVFFFHCGQRRFFIFFAVFFFAIAIWAASESESDSGSESGSGSGSGCDSFLIAAVDGKKSQIRHVK